MPGLLPAVIEGLNDKWSVQLLNKARPWPNHCQLPIRDGRAYAEIDLNDGDWDLFLGHPVTADHRDLKLQVSWESPGSWFIEAHNPTDDPIEAKLVTTPGWAVFAFAEDIHLQPGTSKTWLVKEAARP